MDEIQANQGLLIYNYVDSFVIHRPSGVGQGNRLLTVYQHTTATNVSELPSGLDNTWGYFGADIEVADNKSWQHFG